VALRSLGVLGESAMKLGPSIAVFSFAAQMLLACAPPAEPPPTRSAAVCNSDVIAAKVVDLNPPFSAESFGDCNAAGSSCDVPPTGASPSAFAPKITAAFAIAPDFFRRELCALDKIYIVNHPELRTRNPTAWGMRQRLQSNKTHIAISTDVWGSPIPATPYIAYENGILDRLLEHLWPPPQGASYTAAVADNEPLETLGILAHEVGHVLWWTKSIVALQCPVNGVFDTFYGSTWRNIDLRHGFHRFGVSQGTHLTETFTKDDIVRDLRRQRPQDAGAKLQTVYGNGNWTSLFAFIAPDEDFVETYKYWVLANASGTNLQSLKIQIPLPSPLTVDVFTNFNNANSNLGKKRIWIDAMVQQRCT
jgi:hypothetical protein